MTRRRGPPPADFGVCRQMAEDDRRRYEAWEAALDGADRCPECADARQWDEGFWTPEALDIYFPPDYRRATYREPPEVLAEGVVLCLNCIERYRTPE